jgi:hypothetical protein
VPLGLGIGRLVFRALAVAELALAAALTLALVLELGAVIIGAAAWTLTALLWAVLVVQAVLLRPRLHQRALLVLAGENPPRSRLHLPYVALDGIKVVLLSSVGVVLVAGIVMAVSVRERAAPWLQVDGSFRDLPAMTLSPER